MFCLIIYTICICNILSVNSVVVETTLGPVKGKLVDDAITGALYYSFEGIKYAEPPVGDLRFKPPVRKRKSDTVIDATKPGCVCPQPDLFYCREQMSEDCLNFNIYTPANYQNKLFPVKVYIHGGDFKLQSGNAEPILGPQFLILSDIVVVTMNYRLGALGFLSLCNEEASGNAGIKDVLLLLKIVKENIECFGGDPNKITLSGNGAGSVIAQYLMLTEQCTGLFQKVILQSGSIISDKYTQFHPRRNALLLGKELGLNLTNDNCLLEDLKCVSAFDLVEAQEVIDERDPQRGFRVYSAFKPTVEIECESAIVTRPPLQLLEEGAILDLPIFIGFNTQEGLEIFPQLKNNPKLIEKLNKDFELCVPEDILYPYGSEARRNVAERIRNFYFNGDDISFTNIQNYLNLVSDSQYTFRIDQFITLFKANKCSPVYYYVLGADTELNWFKDIANITYPGTAHNDDLGYSFLTSVTKNNYQCIDTFTKRMQDVAQNNVKYFMNYGAPAPNPYVNCFPETGKDHFYLKQGEANRVVFHRPLPERIGFWYSVFDEYLACSKDLGYYFCTNDDVGSVQG